MGREDRYYRYYHRATLTLIELPGTLLESRVLDVLVGKLHDELL